MTIWHRDLLPCIPTRLLCALHRDVCLAKGKGWGKGGRELAYIWLYGFAPLHSYHIAVMAEMRRRGWKPSSMWLDPMWRGGYHGRIPDGELTYGPESYPEHNGVLLTHQIAKLLKLAGCSKLWAPGELDKLAGFVAGRLK